MDKQASHLGRREFLAAAATGGVGMALEPAANQGAAGKPKGHSGRLRVVLVGTGERGSNNWGKSLQNNYGDVLEFVGLCDINRKRMAVAREYIGVNCPMFVDTEFDEMIRKTSPDRVIVTTIDSFHPKYICRAMELGVDVISEKPMATDEKMVQEVLDTREAHRAAKLIIAEELPVQPGCGSHQENHRLGGDRRHHFRRLQRLSEHRSRRLLLPPLARIQAVQRLAAEFTRAATSSTWSNGGWEPNPRRSRLSGRSAAMGTTASIAASAA